MTAYKKFLLVLLVLSLSIGAIGAEGKKEEAAPIAKKEGTVDLWHEWGSGQVKENLDAVIALFEQKNPEIDFIERAIPGGRYEVQRQLALAFMGGDPPEIFELGPGQQVKTFVDAGRLEPITDVWEEIKADEIFPKGVSSMLYFDNEAWAMPLNIMTLNAVWYNKKIFNEFDLTPPKIGRASCRERV